MSKSAPKRALLNPHFILLGVAALLYLLPIFLFPAKPDPRYHFSTFAIIAISVTVIVPWLAAWFAGVNGYVHLDYYAASIKDKQAARPFQLIARGIMVLVWGLIVATLISTLRSHNLATPAIVVPTTIIANYLYALTPLAGFYFIWKAIRQLNPVKKSAEPAHPTNVIVWVGIAALSVAYLYLNFTNPNRQVAFGATMPAAYYLPDWLILLTISLPVIVSWVFGAMAVIDMYRYQRVVSGFIYRKFMGTLALGVIMIVSGSILLEGVQSLGSQRLLGAGLGWLLAIVYVFLMVQLAGYALVSRGSKKLTLIETA